MNDKLKHKIINYLNKEYSGLVRYEMDKDPDHIFFMKDDNLIFFYNKINRDVYVSYDKIWSVLESFFELEYNEIQNITKTWVEEHNKLRVTKTLLTKISYEPWIKEHFKLKVTATTYHQMF